MRVQYVIVESSHIWMEHFAGADPSWAIRFIDGQLENRAPSSRRSARKCSVIICGFLGLLQPTASPTIVHAPRVSHVYPDNDLSLCPTPTIVGARHSFGRACGSTSYVGAAVNRLARMSLLPDLLWGRTSSRSTQEATLFPLLLHTYNNAESPTHVS